MEKENTNGRKELIKKIAVVFLVSLLILTFFSNTIMNYSLPEVATSQVYSSSVSNKVRGQGAVETNSDYEVSVSGARVIKEVKIQAGDEVKKGQVLFTFEEGENTELNEAEETLEQMELDYAKSLLKVLPDYTTDNMDIQDAKEELTAAQKAEGEAKNNSALLATARQEAADAKTLVDEQQKKVDGIQEKIDDLGEVGDLAAAKEVLKGLEAELVTLKNQLSDLKEDLKTAQNEGTPTKDIERSIRDKEIEISNKEGDVKSAKKTVSSLSTLTGSYDSLKEELTKESRVLSGYQKSYEEKNAKVEELSALPSYEEAKQNVRDKQNSLTRLLLALKDRKEQDSLTQQSEDMDLRAAEKRIQEQKDKIEEIKKSSDLKEIKSKEDGVVADVSCKEGDSVSADMPLANIQLAESGYIVKFTISKNQASLIKPGDEATVENIWDDSVEATVKNIQGDPENPSQNRIVTFSVKGNVVVGENLALSVGEKSNRYDTVVPNNAVKEDSNGKFVLVVTVKGTPLGNRYIVKRANVDVQASDDSNSAVSGDVYEYENVVTNSSKPLEEGMQVRLAE